MIKKDFMPNEVKLLSNKPIHTQKNKTTGSSDRYALKNFINIFTRNKTYTIFFFTLYLRKSFKTIGRDLHLMKHTSSFFKQ